jgi:hypothetical protein
MAASGRFCNEHLGGLLGAGRLHKALQFFVIFAAWVMGTRDRQYKNNLNKVSVETSVVVLFAKRISQQKR